MRLALIALFPLAAACGDDAPACDEGPDPAAPSAVDAALAAVHAATVVDVSVGGLARWTYDGSDTGEATIGAFQAVFAALDAPPWDACVEYEDTGFSSMNTTFDGCDATDATPAVAGTVHVDIVADPPSGDAGLQLRTSLLASGIQIDDVSLDLTARFTWDPSPEAAGVRSQELTATVTLGSGTTVSVAGRVGLDADPACQRIEGDLAMVGTPGALTAEAFEQCLRRCPSEGGRIAYEAEGGRVEIDFDGSDTAIAHGACGDFDVGLDCGD